MTGARISILETSPSPSTKASTVIALARELGFEIGEITTQTDEVSVAGSKYDERDQLRDSNHILYNREQTYKSIHSPSLPEERNLELPFAEFSPEQGRLEDLRKEVSFLRNQIEILMVDSRRKDDLIASLIERIPKA
jgi:hypothetical protein